MRWFSIKGIIEEMKKVHWPKAGELARSSFTVILFGFSMLTVCTWEYLGIYILYNELSSK